MKHTFCLLSLLAGLALPAAQGAIIEPHAFNGLSLPIPDGNPTGLGNHQTISSGIGYIENISVTLNVSGSFNGDLYVYLQHDSGFAVLLNRTGRTNVNLFGYADGGINVTFNDLGGVNPDVHLYQDVVGPQNPLVGLWGSDGRNVDPDTVVDTDARTADLTSFNTGDANGDWTLFVADVSGGGGHVLESWSMEITGQVPEPGTLSLLLLGAGLLARRKR
jgi:subtilisin-like proprotein convertase family protein